MCLRCELSNPSLRYFDTPLDFINLPMPTHDRSSLSFLWSAQREGGVGYLLRTIFLLLKAKPHPTGAFGPSMCGGIDIGRFSGFRYGEQKGEK